MSNFARTSLGPRLGLGAVECQAGERGSANFPTRKAAHLPVFDPQLGPQDGMAQPGRVPGIPGGFSGLRATRGRTARAPKQFVMIKAGDNSLLRHSRIFRSRPSARQHTVV